MYYKGQQIIGSEINSNDVELEKGGTLDFVLSKQVGGEIAIPKLVCMEKTAALFWLQDGLRLKAGKITGAQNGFVSSQTPAFDPNGRMQIGQTIDLVISENKPSICE